MSKLNILNLATTDEGGAGIASRNLNDLFKKSGHNSILLVKESKQINKNVVVVNKRPIITHFNVFYGKVLKRLERYFVKFKVGKLETKYAFFNVFEKRQHIKASSILENINFKPDIIVLHWISNFINSKTIKELQEQTDAKLYWMMMDNSPLTGGCHYPWDCRGYVTDCSDCPAILNTQKKNVALKNLAYKNKYLPNNLELLTCSESDYLRSKKSYIFKENIIHKVLLPIDEKKYQIGNQKNAKIFFNIDNAQKVILYGALSINNVRKGGKYFLEAISILQEKILKEGMELNKYVILLAGGGNIDEYKSIKIPIIQTGYLNEENLIKSYQAADVFVSTSVEDSGPLMINQSIMCGTPVVAFEMGVAIDLVKTGETGYLAKLMVSEDLANGINDILKAGRNESKKVRGNCREMGIIKLNKERQVNKLIEIFNIDSKK